MILVALLLLLAALALVVAELFLPTHGLLALLAAGCAIASVFFAYRAGPLVALGFCVLILIATPIVFYSAVKIYPRTSVGKRVLLQHPEPVTGFDHEADQLAALVGRQGVASTMLRPAGTIEVDGRTIDALSESEVIESGARVEVIRVTGLKVFVKAV